jgi:hypothetical protein
MYIHTHRSPRCSKAVIVDTAVWSKRDLHESCGWCDGVARWVCAWKLDKLLLLRAANFCALIHAHDVVEGLVIYTYIYIYVYIYRHMYIHTCMWMCVYVCMCADPMRSFSRLVQRLSRMYVCMFVWVYVVFCSGGYVFMYAGCNSGLSMHVCTNVCIGEIW